MQRHAWWWKAALPPLCIDTGRGYLCEKGHRLYKSHFEFDAKRLIAQTTCKSILEALASCNAVPTSTAIDATYVKAQRATFSGKGGACAGNRPLARRPDHQDPRAHSPTSSDAPMRSRSRRATSPT